MYSLGPAIREIGTALPCHFLAASSPHYSPFCRRALYDAHCSQMPDNGDSIAARYACHCLNVRFQSLPTQTSPPDENRDPAFIPVFVGDDGIKIVGNIVSGSYFRLLTTFRQHHIQTTVRSKSRGIPIPGTNRCLQYTNLRCLLCDTLTYQICNILSIEMESAEGPLLPSDDWAETEIMKSANGWIDIHKDCLVRLLLLCLVYL